MHSVIALLFSRTFGTRCGWEVRPTPRPPLPVTHCKGGWVGPQGRSGRAENLVPIGIRSRTVQPVVSHTDWATRPYNRNIRTWKSSETCHSNPPTPGGLSSCNWTRNQTTWDEVKRMHFHLHRVTLQADRPVLYKKKKNSLAVTHHSTYSVQLTLMGEGGRGVPLRILNL